MKMDAPIAGTHSSVRDPRLSRQQTAKANEHRRLGNPQRRRRVTENLKLRSRLKLFGCIHSVGARIRSLPCLVAGEDQGIGWRQRLPSAFSKRRARALRTLR
jgi:hypothetical protein